MPDDAENEIERLRAELAEARRKLSSAELAHDRIRSSVSYRAVRVATWPLRRVRDAMTRRRKTAVTKATEAAGLLLTARRARSSSSASRSNAGRIVFATVVTDSFVPGLELLLGTLQENHPRFDYPFIVFHDSGLSEDSKSSLREVYERVEFRPIPAEHYVDVPPHPRLGVAAYYAIEMFSIRDADKVIFLDSDQMCLGPIDTLIDADCDLGACANLGLNLDLERQRGSENYIFNTGMLVVGSKYLTDDTYRGVLDLAVRNPAPNDERLARFCDQRVLNMYFADKPVHFFSASFNCLKRLYKSYPRFDLENISLLHFVGTKPWMTYEQLPRSEAGYGPLNELWTRKYRDIKTAARWRSYESSGELDRIRALRGVHAGQRAFIIGNGPSLERQDLSVLRNEITFVTNWFVMHEAFEEIDPTYWVTASHQLFGGWGNPEPKLNADIHRLLLEKAKNTTKIVPYRFKDYVEREDAFAGESPYYLFFEKPSKEFVTKHGRFQLDIGRPLHDAYTGIITFCFQLVHHFGIDEIYLLGCDCDYGDPAPGGKLAYFYDSTKFATRRSSPEHLQRVWSAGGAVFKAYQMAADTLASHGIRVYNATAGGRLEVFPRVELESLSFSSGTPAPSRRTPTPT